MTGVTLQRDTKMKPSFGFLNLVTLILGTTGISLFPLRIARIKLPDGSSIINLGIVMEEIATRPRDIEQ